MIKRSLARKLSVLAIACVAICSVIALSSCSFAWKAGTDIADIDKSPSGEVWDRPLDGGWMVHKSTYDGFTSSEAAQAAYSDANAKPNSYAHAVK